MFTHKNLMTVCCAAVLAFGLAACGSSSDDDTMAAKTPTVTGGDTGGDTGGMPDACDAGPSQACVDARQAELEAIENDSDATVGALNAAQMALATAQTALSDANTADAEEMTVSGLIDDAMTATADIDDESTPAAVAAGRAAIDAAKESLDGMENLSADAKAALQGRIDTLEAGYSPIEMTVATNAAINAAGTKATEIRAEAAQGTEDNPDAGLGGSDLEEGGAYMPTISRDRDGTTVKIAVGGAAADDPKFIKQDVGLDGGRTMLVLTMEPGDDGEVVEEVVIVKTDIDAPKATPFAMVRNPAGELTQELDTSTDDDADTNEALAVAVDEDSAADVRALVKSADFVPGPGTITVLTFARFQMDSDDVADGDQTIEAFETAGTYNGAMGTYKCNAGADDSDCTVTLDAKGAITGMTAGWIFTPATGAESYVADAEYLHYGFWLKTTTKDGATTYNEVETFAEATGIVESATGTDGVGAVRGTAMYKGGSVGVYVKNVLDDQADIVSATSGHFSADVDLTATFGGGNLPDYDQFTIGGKITGFVLQHGEANDWAVGLGLADFSGREVGDEPGKSDPGSTFPNTFSGVAIGDSTAAPGSWNGVFHGVAGLIDHDTVEATPAINTPPAAVVGEFNANFTDGTAAGGFGANN